jgi:hypothetical protein
MQDNLVLYGIHVNLHIDNIIDSLLLVIYIVMHAVYVLL